MTSPPTAPDDIEESLALHQERLELAAKTIEAFIGNPRNNRARDVRSAAVFMIDLAVRLRAELTSYKTEVGDLHEHADQMEAEITRLRAQPLAAYPDYLAQDAQSPGQPVVHASDCAIHRGPAYPPGPCDCGAQSPGQPPVRVVGKDGKWHDLDTMDGTSPATQLAHARYPSPEQPQEGGEEPAGRRPDPSAANTEGEAGAAVSLPTGWVLVPREPTEEMVTEIACAAERTEGKARALWHTALAAAPSPALTDGDVVERVARAIHAARGDGYPWFHEDFAKCRHSRELARAALAEIGGLK